MIDGEPSALIECNICFGVIRAVSIDDHRHWHRVAGSPMGHGLYLLQFPELDGEVSDDTR